MPYLQKNGDRREIIDTTKNGKIVFYQDGNMEYWQIITTLLADGWEVIEDEKPCHKIFDKDCCYCQKELYENENIECECGMRTCLKFDHSTVKEDEKSELFSCKWCGGDNTKPPLFGDEKPTPWTPEVGGKYWFPRMDEKREVYWDFWGVDETDRHRLSLGIVCRTRAEAEAKYDEIIGLIKK